MTRGEGGGSRNQGSAQFDDYDTHTHTHTVNERSERCHQSGVFSSTVGATVKECVYTHTAQQRQ